MQTHMCLLIVVILFAVSESSQFTPEIYDVIWSSPSADERGALPIGNGDIALSVWADADAQAMGSVFSFYVSKQDAFDENADLLKLASGSVSSDSPLHGAFEFRLHITNSTISISYSSIRCGIWVDANNPLVSIECSSSQPQTLNVTLNVWRQAPQYPQSVAADITGGQFCQPRLTTADYVTTDTTQQSLIWYHHNGAPAQEATSYWESSMTLQGLSAALSQLSDPLANRTFGGVMTGDSMRVQDRSVVSTAAARQHRVTISILTNTTTATDWVSQALERNFALRAADAAQMRLQHNQWWDEFWARSYINVSRADTAADADLVSALYSYSRYVFACNGRGAAPIKFNGMLHTVDPSVGGTAQLGGADYRRWGSGFWWQNTREPYMSMSTSGDSDMLAHMYQHYVSQLPLAELRTMLWYNHSGAFFPETASVFGLLWDNGWGYGCSVKSDHVPDNTYIRFYVQGGLELLQLMLDDFAVTGNHTTVSEYIVPLADGVTRFYQQHFPQRDADGKTVFFPMQSLETWQCPDPSDVSNCVTNPTPDIAALMFVLPRLLKLPAQFITQDQVRRWTDMLQTLPPIPVAQDVIQPALRTNGHTTNSENAELYSVHPYRVYSVAHQDTLPLAINTYQHRRFPCNDGWCYDILDAALLGLTSDAQKMLLQRAQQAPASGWRFVAFTGPFQDYTPSADQLGVYNTALQLMLMQPLDNDEEGVILFPAWPSQWDVTFKLHAARNTVIEATCTNGHVTMLQVSPPERRSAVKIGSGCALP